ncbi:MAG: hypothetical protein ACR2OH_11065 [Microthrixaceae bacterium]
MSIQQRLTRFGTVTDFDEPVGLGELTDSEGAVHSFHCTAIADGSRDIQVGAEVSFRLEPGRKGQMEAVDLCPR